MRLRSRARIRLDEHYAAIYLEVRVSRSLPGGGRGGELANGELAMHELYTEFLRLDRSWHRPPRPFHGNEGNYAVLKQNFIRAQAAMFHLAQAICQLASPDVQRELDDARREVMDELTRAPKGLEVHVAALARSAPRWQEFEITPEVTFDHSLAGSPVSKHAAMRLKRAHKHQVSVVTHLLAEYRRFHADELRKA